MVRTLLRMRVNQDKGGRVEYDYYLKNLRQVKRDRVAQRETDS